MSQSSAKTAARRARVRAQLDQIRKTRRQGIVGIRELAGLLIAGLTVLAVAVGYFYFLAPAQSRLNGLQLERDRLQKQLRVSTDTVTRGMDTKATVEKIGQSLEVFEKSRLVSREGGRMLLYEDLNQLIHKNGLRNTSGPTYTTLDPLGSKNADATATKSAATKWQSVYPGIAVNVTVEGQYQNIRHFVRDIETGTAFTIINAVELERATESNNQAVDATGKSANNLVSLRLDLVTYFQRQGQQAEQEAPADH